MNFYLCTESQEKVVSSNAVENWKTSVFLLGFIYTTLIVTTEVSRWWNLRWEMHLL